MPVATSSRRRQLARRQNSSDIEDSRPTQANGHVDDVSDDDRPRPGKKAVKKEKKANGKQKATTEDEDEGANGSDDNDSDDDRIDVANFPDQPLRKNDLHKLKGISDDWDKIYTQTSQEANIIRDVAAAMAEAGDGDLNSEGLQGLDETMREFIDIGAEMKAHSKTLDEMHQQIARGEQVVNAVDSYKQGVSDKLEEYAGKTTRQKYARDTKYHEFRTGIWEVHNPETAMPPLTEFIEKEDGDDSDEDDDVEMGGATQNFNCPITLTPLVNPVTSRVCKHSFSADAIKEFCKDGRGLVKCPASGCNKSFRLSDCVQDDALAKKVKAYRRRMQAAAEDSDAEEVIE